MRMVFLGTGGSWPSKEAAVSAIALRMPNRTLLFDCGEGTQRQLMFSSVSFMTISHIFISHYHGDHFLGLPGLIQSMSLNDRKDKLVIVGPEGVDKVVKAVLGLGYFTLTFPVETRTATPGEPMDVGGAKVTPFKADHTVPGVGYVLEEPPRPGRFNKKKALEIGIPEGPMFSRLQRGEEIMVGGKTFRPEDVMGPPRPGRKIMFTGDTRPISPIPQSWKDCDVMVHEATFAQDMEARAIEYGHATAGHAAQAAKDAGALRLFMVHRSPRYKDPALLLEEARKIFPETYAPVDLEEYEVPLRY